MKQILFIIITLSLTLLSCKKDKLVDCWDCVITKNNSHQWGWGSNSVKFDYETVCGYSQDEILIYEEDNSWTNPTGWQITRCRKK